MANERRNLHWYKINISLPDFIIYSNCGFEIDSKSTSKNPRFYTPLTDESGNVVMKSKNKPQKDSIIVVALSEKDDHQLYWDIAHSGLDQAKTIIDFVNDYVLKNRSKSIDFKSVVEVLEAYLNDGHTQLKTTKSLFKLAPISKDRVPFDLSKLHRYEDQEYLENRHIYADIYDSDTFKGTVRSYKYTYEKPETDKSTGKEKTTTRQHSNTAFIMVDEKGIVAINTKYFRPSGETIKTIYGSKKTSLYLSKLLTDISSYDELVVSESPEDAMAYYAFFHQDNIHTRYASTCGVVTEEQCSLITKQFNKYNIEHLILANDNDVSGAQQNAVILANFFPNSIYYSEFTIDCKRVNKQGIVTIIYTNSLENKIIMANQFVQEIQKLNNSASGTTNIEHNSLNSKTVETSISFHSCKENWSLLVGLIHNIKFNKTKRIQVSKPKLKDFNEDLVFINNNQS